MYTMKEKFIENGIEYVLCGDYYLPNFKLPEENHTIGKYGRLHEKYLKENHSCFYSLMLMQGNLNEYLAKVDLRAKTELDRLITLLAEQQGVTEELKAQNQLKWVGLMNNIKKQAEEIIDSNIVYNREALYSI